MAKSVKSVKIASSVFIGSGGNTEHPYTPMEAANNAGFNINANRNFSAVVNSRVFQYISINKRPEFRDHDVNNFNQNAKKRR